MELKTKNKAGWSVVTRLLEYLNANCPRVSIDSDLESIKDVYKQGSLGVARVYAFSLDISTFPILDVAYLLSSMYEIDYRKSVTFVSFGGKTYEVENKKTVTEIVYVELENYLKKAYTKGFGTNSTVKFIVFDKKLMSGYLRDDKNLVCDFVFHAYHRFLASQYALEFTKNCKTRIDFKIASTMLFTSLFTNGLANNRISYFKYTENPLTYNVYMMFTKFIWLWDYHCKVKSTKLVVSLKYYDDLNAFGGISNRYAFEVPANSGKDRALYSLLESVFVLTANGKFIKEIYNYQS